MRSDSISITELAREEIKQVEPCIHGGNIWEEARKYNLEYDEILDFSANVNPLGPCKKALKKIKDNLWQIPFYPEPNSATLRKTISHKISEIDMDNVIVGNGSTELIYLFSEVFIEKGDEPLIPAPTFGEYENAVRRAGGKPKHIICQSDFSLNLTQLMQKIKPKTKAVFLCNPNNPTSTLIPEDSLIQVLEKAAEENVLVFLDENFMEFTDDEKRFSLTNKVKTHRNLFIIQSFTKIFGLTGIRVGYGIACDEMIKLLLKAKPPWNVNCLAQPAAIAALKDTEYLRKTRRLLKEERKFLLDNLRQIKELRIFPAHANFIFTDVRKTGLTASQIKERMLREGILIRDCSSFRGLDEYYIRVAIRTHKENKELLSVLQKVLSTA
ncbi:MAG: threonine-phosphate decarboxylase CobD [Thermoproteota archaeon]